MDAINKIEYTIRDLGTRSVTLFPSRAQIYRDIKGIDLKTGTNEITILGLSPTVDEDSIKVEGSGSAVISDITVESLPNRDLFDDFYPDSDVGKTDDEDDDDSDDALEEAQESTELTQARARLLKLKDDQVNAVEQVTNADIRMKALSSYSSTLRAQDKLDLEGQLQAIKDERRKAYDDHTVGAQRQREIDSDITQASKEVAKLERAHERARKHIERAKKKAQIIKAKELAQKARRLEERNKEKKRIRAERESFWPKYCYSVRITLEVSGYTPASSRRASMSSDTEVSLVPPFKARKTEDKDDDQEPQTCDLGLSYVTTSAYWLPSYDLQLSTTTDTGALCFDAQVHNLTSETWTNCKVSLSTSQANFAVLQERIPSLVPWNIKLASRDVSQHDLDILKSTDEQSNINQYYAKRQVHSAQKPRDALFGLQGGSSVRAEYDRQLNKLSEARKRKIKLTEQQMDLLRAPPPAPIQSYQPAAPMSRPAPPGAAPRVRLASMAARRSPHAAMEPQSYEDDDEDNDMGFGIYDDEYAGKLGFEEPPVEETGLTTTYDLPGLKTLAPKATASKQRVARVTFSNVQFGHTVVAKYEPVAYHKAKLRNNSKHSLLKGQAGLTLDGTFLGKTSIPRCSPGEHLTLSLGIDPAVKVVYPKPDVRRTTTGMFSKEDSSVYVRSITLNNTRPSSSKPISLVVHDQVPVSQDEKLRVEIYTPRGVSATGGSVPVADAGRDAGTNVKWGKASATLKDSGEVNWNMTLNPGKTVKLALEYAVTLPSGEAAMQSR